jgi:hypothetical protein
MRASPTIRAAHFFLATILFCRTTRADFVPIALTGDSFNQDLVVEKTAPPPIVPVTTASMDTGTLNTGFAWYEIGYNSLWLTTGFPTAGSVIVGDSLTDHSYRFASNYKTNNAVLIDSTLTNASLTLVTPTKCARLSFLLASGNGSGMIRATVHHQDSTSETATNSCPDWMTSVGETYLAAGRVDVTQFTFDNVATTSPNLFGRDLIVSNTNSPITSVEFSYIGGASHIAIFAISGSTNLVDTFDPINVTGFNADLVVEASAARREYLAAVTSASMDNGTANVGRTWYERGYYPVASSTGVPAPGSLLTNAVAPDHVFVMPPSYNTNNALMLDTVLQNGTLTPIAPTTCSALSFLCASGHGPVTNQCVVQHANGVSGSNNLIIVDWFDSSPAAFVANGDVNLNNRMVDSIGANNTKLFSIDIAVANTTSPVTNLLITFNGGPPNSHSIIFALSGLAPQGTGVRPILSISRLPAGNLRISTSHAGQLQSTTALNTNTVWQNEGIISSTIDVSPSVGISAKFYRVIAQ